MQIHKSYNLDYVHRIVVCDELTQKTFSNNYQADYETMNLNVKIMLKDHSTENNSKSLDLGTTPFMVPIGLSDISGSLLEILSPQRSINNLRSLDEDLDFACAFFCLSRNQLCT